MVTAIACLHRGILLLGACLACQALSLKTATSGHNEGRSITLSNSGPIEHELLICNAYASRKPLAVYRLSESRYLTGDVPIAYKECRNFPLHLQEGEGFEFQAGELKVGTFSTTGLPTSSTTLLLVPMRRSLLGLSAKFASHAFVGGKSAQVAVVDAFRTADGAGKDGAVKIADRGGDGEGAAGRKREEDLHFDSVVALGPGRYELAMTGGSSHSEAEVPMQTSGSSRHVVMRVGMDSDNRTDAESYPQELVVFPRVAAAVENSAASRPGLFASAAVAMMLAAVLAAAA